MSHPADTAQSNVRYLPGEGQGTLTTPHGETLPVRTFKHGQDVLLVVLVDADEPAEDERVESAELRYTSVRGVIRLHGEAVFEDRSLIRFHPEGEAEVSQRRSFVRVSAPRPVTLSVDDAEERPAHVVDLSGGGMLLVGADVLAPQQTVRFSITLDPEFGSIEGVGRVVRVSDDGKRALVFEQIDEDDRQRLIRFVFHCMRSARARTRADRL